MTDVSLKHHTLIFDPDLDLESVHELPGKEVTAAVAETFAKNKIFCSKFIQDSHGWCFKVHGDDSRRYLIELIYVTTNNQVSDWVLTCDQLSGIRIWEYFKSRSATIGLEQRYLNEALEILVSKHGFEKTQAP